MNINFVKLLDKTKDGWSTLFNVDGKNIEIGISGTTLAVWKITDHERAVIAFLKQFGDLKIQWMITENKLQDYVFISDYFKDVKGDILPIEKLQDYIQDKIIEAEDYQLTK